MPNWVPQSPTWLSLITWWPANSVTRAIASPTIVVRRWPTCISFAMFGEEYSTMTVSGASVSGVPSRGSPSRVVVASAIHSGRSVKLTNPGPLTVGASLMPPTSRWLTMSAATSRGALPSFLASGSAALDWKSANEDGRISGSALA